MPTTVVLFVSPSCGPITSSGIEDARKIFPGTPAMVIVAEADTVLDDIDASDVASVRLEVGADLFAGAVEWALANIDDKVVVSPLDCLPPAKFWQMCTTCFADNEDCVMLYRPKWLAVGDRRNTLTLDDLLLNNPVGTHLAIRTSRLSTAEKKLDRKLPPTVQLWDLWIRWAKSHVVDEIHVEGKLSPILESAADDDAINTLYEKHKQDYAAANMAAAFNRFASQRFPSLAQFGSRMHLLRTSLAQAKPAPESSEPRPKVRKYPKWSAGWAKQGAIRARDRTLATVNKARRFERRRLRAVTRIPLRHLEGIIAERIFNKFIIKERGSTIRDA